MRRLSTNLFLDTGLNLVIDSTMPIHQNQTSPIYKVAALRGVQWARFSGRGRLQSLEVHREASAWQAESLDSAGCSRALPMASHTSASPALAGVWGLQPQPVPAMARSRTTAVRHPRDCAALVNPVRSSGVQFDAAVGSRQSGPIPAMAAAVKLVAATANGVFQSYLGGERLYWWRHHARTFRHNHFTYLNPTEGLFSQAQLLAHYAVQVEKSGTFAGFVEVHALGCLLKRKIVLYDHPGEKENLWGVCRAYFSRRGLPLRQLACLGPDEALCEGPVLHLAYLKFGHFRSLLLQASPTEAIHWHEIEAGGGGDCLYRAVAHSLRAVAGAQQRWTAEKLRAGAAQRIGTDLQFMQLVYNQTCNAFFEYQQAHAYARPGPSNVGLASAEHAHKLPAPPACETDSLAHRA